MIVQAEKSAGQPVAIFLHAAKTGGTSFINWLRLYFDNNILWGREAEILAVLGKNPPSDPNSFDSICGHFSTDAPFVSAIRRPIIYLSLVREPVSRAASLYAFVQRQPQNCLFSEVDGRTLFESLNLRRSFFARVSNWQTRLFLKMLASRNPILLDHYDRQERLAERVIARFQRDASTVMPRDNVAPEGYTRAIEEQSDYGRAVDLLRSVNREDAELVAAVGSGLEIN